MIRHICDICKENDANTKFKVKRTDRRGTFEIDICNKCYDKLLSIKSDNDNPNPNYVPPKSIK